MAFLPPLSPVFPIFKWPSDLQTAFRTAVPVLPAAPAAAIQEAPRVAVEEDPEPPVPSSGAMLSIASSSSQLGLGYCSELPSSSSATVLAESLNSVGPKVATLPEPSVVHTSAEDPEESPEATQESTPTSGDSGAATLPTSYRTAPISLSDTPQRPMRLR